MPVPVTAVPRPTTVRKHRGATRRYRFHFESFEEVIDGETLSSPDVTVSPSGPTLGTPTVSGSIVYCVVAGGTAGTQYTLTATATASGGGTLAMDGYLNVY